MTCDCGRPLEPYIVEVDGEQYIEDLCPRCAFAKPNPIETRLTLDSNDISELSFRMDRSVHFSGQRLMEPASITGSFKIDPVTFPGAFSFDEDVYDIEMSMGREKVILKECRIMSFTSQVGIGPNQAKIHFVAQSVKYV